jgi:hypothetical protein
MSNNESFNQDNGLDTMHPHRNGLHLLANSPCLSNTILLSPNPARTDLFPWLSIG